MPQSQKPLQSIKPNQSPDAMKEAFRKARETYANDPKKDTFNALICGELGTGKTHILKTARKPVWGHFFDEGGERTLRDEIDAGEVVPETFIDDRMKPEAFRRWVTRFMEMQKSGIFHHIGTFALDSSTMWAEAIMNAVLLKRGAAGETPKAFEDYMPQKTLIKNWIGQILSLPCDVIVTGHLKETRDEVTGRVTYRYATTGDGTTLIPAQFDEVYVTLSEDTSKGVSYKLKTAGAGRYAARSRLAQGGRFETYEEPNIKHLLRKAGYPTDDKPLFL